MTHPSKQAKLSDLEREQIFALKEQGHTVIQLADKFKVSQTTIRNLLKKRTYQPNKKHWS